MCVMKYWQLLLNTPILYYTQHQAATATVSRVLDVDIEEQQLGTASDHEMVDMVLEEIEDEDETNTDDHQVLPVASNTTEGIEPSI